MKAWEEKDLAPWPSWMPAGKQQVGYALEKKPEVNHVSTPASDLHAEAIAEIASVRATLVLYESGPRLADTLGALSNQLGDREAAVARELTKLHEECVTGSLAELAARYAAASPKGEIVIVVGPPAAVEAASDSDLDAALDEALVRLSPSRAAAEVAERLKVPRKRAYARALERS